MLLKHSFIYTIGKGVPSIVSLLAITLFTTYLTPAEFGEYALVLSVASITGSIFYDWLILAHLRFIQSKDATASDRLLRTVLTTFVWSIFITAVISAAVVPFLSFEWQTLALIGLPIIWAEGFFNLTVNVLRGNLKPVTYSILFLLRAIVYISVGGGLAYSGAGALAPLSGLLAGSVLASLFISSKVWKPVRMKLDVSLIKTLFIYGSPFIVSFALNFIVNSSDRFIIAYLLGNEEVGQYSAAYQFTWRSVSALLMIISTSSNPLILRAFDNKGMKSANIELRNTGLLIALIGIPSCLGIIALRENISYVFIGSAFKNDAIELIPWIAVAALIYAFKSFYVDTGFQIAKKTHLQIWPSLLAAIVNIILNFWLIPVYGILGAAIATLVAFVVGLLSSAVLVVRAYPFPKVAWKDMILILGGSLMMCIPLVLWDPEPGIWHLTLQLLIAGSIFLFFLMIFNIMNLRTLLLNKLNSE
ncbi:MAG: oligosaccharide flippase family protein [Bacteroidia bacterium]